MAWNSANFDALRATGLVIQGDAMSGTFLGSCFHFRQPDAVLTADHVVRELSAGQVTVVLPHTLPLETHRVSRIERRSPADIALLVLESPSAATPYADHFKSWALGTEVWAYGFPEDIMAPGIGQPTPRLFRGYYQRFFYYHSPLNYEYNAGELSIGAPGGLSGGPVLHYQMPMRVTGLVTENLESATVLEADEEEIEPGHKRETKYRKVIQYGVSLLLDSHEPWLSKHIPRP